jgi:hypothetical protein
MNLPVAMRNARLQLLVDAIDGGAGAGTLKFYTGPKPATGAAITTETLLGTLTLSDPCGTVATGVLTFAAITQDAAADATGTAVWARALDSTGAFCADFTVGTSAADIILNTVSIVAGGPISITSFTITAGNA